MGVTINIITNLVAIYSFIYFHTWLMNMFCQTLPVFWHGFSGDWHTLMKGLIWWKVCFQLLCFLRKIILLKNYQSPAMLSALCLLFPSRPLFDLILPVLFVFFFSNTEKLGDRKLNVAEVTQSEIGQKQKLQTVLEAVHDLLRPHGWTIKWNVDCKDLLCFLSQLCRQGLYDNQ